MRIYIIFIFFCAGMLCQRLDAQQIIRGTVSDATNASPLIGAAVYINPKIATITDTEGFFELKNTTTPTTSFFVSYLGYLQKEVSLQSFKNGDTIELTPNPQLLNPVVISADKSGRTTNLSPVSVGNLQPYQLHNRISTGMDEAVNQVSGVFVNDGQANIRSGSGWSYGTGSRVAVLLDGMPLLAAGTGQALWNYLPIENVDQIEVIKGAAGVLYGSSALNGVINIRTLTPSTKEIMEASVFGGIYDNPPNAGWKWQGNRNLSKSGAHVLYGNGNKRFQYVFSAYGLADEGYRMSESERRIRLSGNTRVVLGKNAWAGVNGNVQYNRSGSFLLWESYDLAYTSMDSGLSYNDATRWNIDPYFVWQKRYWKHKLQTRILMVDNQIENQNGNPDQSNTSLSYFAEYRVDMNRFEKRGLKVSMGLVALYGDTEANIFQGKKETANTAGYLRAEQKWGKLLLEGGARYEYYRLENFTQGKPVFSVAANYEASKSTFLRASYGEGFRFPVVSEAFIQTNVGAVYIYPNAGLQPETGYNAEIGIRQGIKISSLQFILDVAAFTMEYENMMEFTFGAWGENQGFDNLFGLGFKSVNIGKTRVSGTEINLGAEMKRKKFSLISMAGYTYSDALNLDPLKVYATDNFNGAINYLNTSSDSTGRTLKYRPRHLVKADIQLQWTRVGCGLTYRYTGKMENIDAIFVSPLFEAFAPGIGEAMNNAGNGNHVFDLRVSYNLNSHFKLRFTVNNIFNEEYMLRPADMRPPRSFMLQLSYKL